MVNCRLADSQSVGSVVDRFVEWEFPARREPLWALARMATISHMQSDSSFAAAVYVAARETPI